MNNKNGNHSKSPDPRRARRGATLVLMAILITVLVMFAGLGIDFARMWTFNGQLKVLTDASSHSGALDLGRGDVAPATARALALATTNQVDGIQTATMVEADIEPGVWNFETREFEANEDRDWAGANAVRATARYNASWLLGRIFTGGNNRMLTQSSVAALGSQIESSCLKPFAIPYGTVLEAIGKGEEPMTYSLDTEDLAKLATGVDVTWDMFIGVSGKNPLSEVTPAGGFAMVGFEPLFGPTTKELNKNEYLAAVIPPGCSTASVAVGDKMASVTGVSEGNVLPELEKLCPGRGKGPAEWACTEPVFFQVPVYNATAGQGENATYTVNYIAGFRLTEVRFKSKPNQLFGNLTILPAQSGGGFSPFPGPVTMAVIVK